MDNLVAGRPGCHLQDSGLIDHGRDAAAADVVPTYRRIPARQDRRRGERARLCVERIGHQLAILEGGGGDHESAAAVSRLNGDWLIGGASAGLAAEVVRCVWPS